MATQFNLFIEDLYQQLEMDLLAAIGKTIGNGKGITKDGLLQWQVEKLSQLGGLSHEQVELLAGYAHMTVEQLVVFVQQNAITEIRLFDADMERFEEAGVLYQEPTNTLYSRLNALEKQAQDVMNLVNSRLLQGAEQVYRDILTKSAAKVLIGNGTLQEALVATVKDWASLGIPQMVDKAGRQWSTESYVSMVIRNTQKNVAKEMQEARMDEYGTDLVEISSHAGSRPAHLDYQGRIYSRSGKSRKYPPLSGTSYGAIDGIVTGINCAHRMYVYIEGVNTKRYQPYNKTDSEAVYKEAQKQRQLEREIRAAKKELAVLEQMDVDEAFLASARQKVAQKQKNMRTFLDESGRTRRRQREQVVNVGQAVDLPKDSKILSREAFMKQVTREQKILESKAKQNKE